MKRGGMPLHDAVGISCKRGATTENPGASVMYIYGLRDYVLMIVCVLSDLWLPLFGGGRKSWYITILLFTYVFTASVQLTVATVVCIYISTHLQVSRASVHPSSHMGKSQLHHPQPLHPPGAAGGEISTRHSCTWGSGRVLLSTRCWCLYQKIQRKKCWEFSVAHEYFSLIYYLAVPRV